MTNKLSDLAEMLPDREKRKSPVHKLNPAQFKEQVESLSDTELKRLIEEVQAEKQRRIEESKKVIELFKEAGK